MVCTETDSMEMNKHVVDMYRALVDGLEVVSEFDKWPIREAADEPAAAGAPAAAAGAAAGPSGQSQ
jgi:hypothetical protein